MFPKVNMLLAQASHRNTVGVHAWSQVRVAISGRSVASFLRGQPTSYSEEALLGGSLLSSAGRHEVLRDRLCNG